MEPMAMIFVGLSVLITVGVVISLVHDRGRRANRRDYRDDSPSTGFGSSSSSSASSGGSSSSSSFKGGGGTFLGGGASGSWGASDGGDGGGGGD